MKINVRHILAGALASCLVTACDLDTTPTTSLDAGNAFKNTENAERVLRGAWNYVFNEGNTYASIGLGSIMANDDFAGSDVVRQKSYGFSGSYNLTNGYARGEYNSVLWNLVYDAINNCNGVIKYIDAAEGEAADRNRIKGQALASRGYFYMVLASHYSFAIDKDPNAVCVPVYTEPTDYNQATAGTPASSVSEVYQQALDDLEAARELIPETFSHGTAAIDQYKIDYNVLLGLLARTNLYAHNWEKAYDYANQLLQRKSYLMTEAEYKSGFSDCSNGEWLWAYSSTTDDNFPSYLFHFKDATTKGSYYANFKVDPYFTELFEDGDYRKDLFDVWGPSKPGTTLQDKGEAYLNNAKFKFKDVNNMLADIVLMRVSEIYLIKAEAAAHISGKEAEAREALNTLRAARGASTEASASGDELIKLVWTERRKELWGEGFSLTDIIRNQQSVERKTYSVSAVIDGVNVTKTGHVTVKFNDGTDFIPNSKYYLFRIPLKEELQNSALYSKYPMLDFYR